MLISILKKMELPDDVLQIVRAYAKPRFTHYKEYQLALQLLGVESLPCLKEHLMLHPEQVMPAIQTYEKAHLNYVQAKEEFLLYEPWAMGSKRTDYIMTKCELLDAHDEFLKILFPCYPMTRCTYHVRL
jgi:hypothetical protein